MIELSPAATAVLNAVTPKRYDVPLEELAGFTLQMAPLIANAFHAVADQCGYCLGPDEHEDILGRVVDVNDLLSIAAELGALSDAYLRALANAD